MAVGVDLDSLAPQINKTTIPEDFKSLNSRPPMSGLDQSYSVGNQWFAYLPLEDVLGKRYKNLDLHLRQFTIPQIEMASTEVSFRGYTKEIPTKVVNSASKQLTLSYLIDEYWQNYKSLWAWAQGPVGTINQVSDDEVAGITPSTFIKMRIYLLNNYKKKILQFEFSNVWIKVFNDLQLDVTNQENVEHSFTVGYDDMQMVETEYQLQS